MNVGGNKVVTVAKNMRLGGKGRFDAKLDVVTLSPKQEKGEVKNRSRVKIILNGEGFGQLTEDRASII